MPRTLLLFCALIALWTPPVVSGCAPAADAVRPAPDVAPCAAADRVDTRNWKVVEAGPVTFRLPSAYVEQEVEGVDSYVAEWKTPDGRALSFDFGFYSRPIRTGAHSPAATMIVCQEEQGSAAPQLALYRHVNGQYAAGLYWPKPGGRTLVIGPGAPAPQALRLDATSPRASDQAELLAILTTVRYR